MYCSGNSKIFVMEGSDVGYYLEDVLTTETAGPFETYAHFYQTLRPHMLDDDVLVCEQSLCTGLVKIMLTFKF
jgi:hypothetical protein